MEIFSSNITKIQILQNSIITKIQILQKFKYSTNSKNNKNSNNYNTDLI